jgi:hypothetical protein
LKGRFETSATSLTTFTDCRLDLSNRCFIDIFQHDLRGGVMLPEIQRLPDFIASMCPCLKSAMDSLNERILRGLGSFIFASLLKSRLLAQLAALMSMLR